MFLKKILISDYDIPLFQDPDRKKMSILFKKLLIMNSNVSLYVTKLSLFT